MVRLRPSRVTRRRSQSTRSKPFACDDCGALVFVFGCRQGEAIYPGL